MKINYSKIEGVRNKIGDKYDCIFVVGTYFEDGAMLMFPCDHIRGISLESDYNVFVEIKDLHTDDVHSFSLDKIYFTHADASKAMEKNYIGLKLSMLSAANQRIRGNIDTQTSEDIELDKKKIAANTLDIKALEERSVELLSPEEAARRDLALGVKPGEDVTHFRGIKDNGRVSKN